MEQNYKNHRRYVPLFHVVLFGIIILSLLGSLVNLVQTFSSGKGIYSASLIFVILFCLILIFYFMRLFPLRAQDRAIRAEENLRHFALTGKLLDKRLTIGQITGLRFAEDEEFVRLAKEAVEKKMSGNEIKKAIKNWRQDHLRM
ncbi:MAG TPA: DUF6526 family protein [Ignavibacteriaceae bacterium]|nr:DUF6526 family protein [Ignavibacteriaceae bacterium]